MDDSSNNAEIFYTQTRREAELLAGRLGDLSQRATVYYHLYDDSDGNNVFPLIAAHGALWASGYFRKGLRAGQILSAQYLGHGNTRKAKLQQLQEFADAFRDINRRVCIEAYSAYHLSKHFGDDPYTTTVITSQLLGELNRCHAAQRSGMRLTPAERAALFNAFFIWEQDNIVGPSVQIAVDRFDWPLIKRLALTPKIGFAYFPGWTRLAFNDFSSTDERIEKGRQTYQIAEAVGLSHVEGALEFYKVLPKRFLGTSQARFKRIKVNVLDVLRSAPNVEHRDLAGARG